tara:strand:+ start:85 stop:513 length:429 start_codon:yes stop_codon:yes gene_type:complete
MRYLKYLICGLVLSVLPSCTTAQEVNKSSVTWSEGDKVATFYICRTEKDIMDIALADTKGREALRQSVSKKFITKDCLNLNPPLGFIVNRILGSYLDSSKDETSILSVSIPVKDFSGAPPKSDTAGYIIAVGKPSNLKHNSF